MPSYKLKYFNARGGGEVSRLLFALAGVKYEDERFTPETWPAEKPNIPLGQLPALEIDGKKYGQSSAISRYLARTFGFYGKTDLDALQIDTVLGVIQDVVGVLLPMYFEKDEAKKAELAKAAEEDKLPKLMKMFETLLKMNAGSDYFVGDKITLADVAVFDLCDKIEQLVKFENYPGVKKLREQVGANPKIKDWVEKRPVTKN